MSNTLQMATSESLKEVLDSQISKRSHFTKSSRILIVDDEELNVKVVRKYLSEAGYANFVTTSDPTDALDLMRRKRPDIVLLDVMMPSVSGIDILHVMNLDEQLHHIPVVILTASTELEVKQVCLELGVTDFLAKPVDPMELLPRVRNTLLNKHFQDQLALHAEKLEQEVHKRTAELARSREEVVHCLARAGEFRDDDTGHHVCRVGKYVGVIADELGFNQSLSLIHI